MFPVLAILWGIAAYVTSEPSESDPPASNTQRPGTPGRAGATTQVARAPVAQQPVRDDRAVARQQAFRALQHDVAECLVLYEQGRPLPEHLRHGAFPNRLAMLAERVRREATEHANTQAAPGKSYSPASRC